MKKYAINSILLFVAMSFSGATQANAFRLIGSVLVEGGKIVATSAKKSFFEALGVGIGEVAAQKTLALFAAKHDPETSDCDSPTHLAYDRKICFYPGESSGTYDAYAVVPTSGYQVVNNDDLYDSEYKSMEDLDRDRYRKAMEIREYLIRTYPGYDSQFGQDISVLRGMIFNVVDSTVGDFSRRVERQLQEQDDIIRRAIIDAFTNQPNGTYENPSQQYGPNGGRTEGKLR